MRSELDMRRMLLDFAKNHETIRAATLEGSERRADDSLALLTTYSQSSYPDMWNSLFINPSHLMKNKTPPFHPAPHVRNWHDASAIWMR